ncbi:MAG TPA: hypothetical protein VNA25_07785, partial [Phycisphaerae bacterium]|nr:hypothetical protein [Phycisphaerae bacterium]
MATVTDIADAMVAALNGYAFGQAFTAVRAYVPTFELKDMKDLHVTVVPKGMEVSIAGRGYFATDVQIDVAVQKRLATADNAEIDALMGVVQEIAEFLRRQERFASAAWIKTENLPIYSAEHLGE